MSLLSMETASFNRWLGRVAARTEHSASDILLATALDVLQRIIQGTPVDTGRARAGWSASAERFGISARADEGAHPNEAEQAKGRHESDHHEKLTGRKIYVEMVNGVPYALMLEYGWSKQAPHGMVRIALRTVRRAFKRHVLEAVKKAGQ